MRYITLNDEEKAALEDGWRNSAKHHFRRRCHSILLSSQGYKVPEIANLMNVRTRTIYSWFDNWEKSGIDGLNIQPGRGIRAKLDTITDTEITQIHKQIKLNPQNLNQVCEQLSKTLGFRITKNMLKRFIKKNSVTVGVGSVNV
jgi:transposase